MRPTLVFIRAHYVNGRLIHYFGDECPPGTFSEENVDRALDECHLVEAPDRRSLYRLLPHFSGCKEQEQLTNEERNNLCLNSAH
jgi:hypothetical protein